MSRADCEPSKTVERSSSNYFAATTINMRFDLLIFIFYFPVTGVAKSVTPGGHPHNLRYVMYTPVTVPVTHHVVSTIKLSNASHSVITTVASNVVYNNTAPGLPTATVSFQVSRFLRIS